VNLRNGTALVVLTCLIWSHPAATAVPAQSLPPNSPPVLPQSLSGSPSGPRGGGLSVPPGAGTVPPDAAPGDTAVAVLSGPPSWPRPVSLTIWPDTVAFGGLLTVSVGFPPNTQTESATELIAADLTSQVPWLIWADSFGPEPARGLRGLWQRLTGKGRARAAEPVVIPESQAAAEGLRVQRQARIFRSGPFRLQWQAGGVAAGPASAVLQVASGLAPGDEPVGVRGPRSLGWYWPLLLLLALSVVLLIAGLVWLRRRSRQRGPGLEHASLPPPAYLGVARQLWSLHCEALPAKGEGRRFLDRFAGITRGYLRERFRIHADEMTAGEILTALRSKGYPPAIGRRFADLIRQADDCRYSPRRVSPLTCDDLLARKLELMDEVRVVARYTPVPADLAVAGQKSWGNLRAWLVNGTRMAGAAVGEDT